MKGILGDCCLSAGMFTTNYSKIEFGFVSGRFARTTLRALGLLCLKKVNVCDMLLWLVFHYFDLNDSII